MIRKDEKRIGRQRAKDHKRGNVRDNDFDSLLDVDLLREQREAQMIEKSLEKSKTYNLTEQVQYPFVFDKLAETARQTPIFVTGKSLILPVGAQRTDREDYEEIFLPNEGSEPPREVKARFPLIPINKLDNLAQRAFDGLKQLNQLQSIVFETANNSNENLLVAAPTGAGKTNVALLTVLNTIRQYTDPSGKIRLRDFKIVYVAPMKALAAE